ncbi:MAG TPA: hypothetical protein DCQ32_00250 [Cyanobacteria bacterium UBA8156]|jgi:hypothetical protein|nr:hypothetical protein [Cyanobacteria bacterium UBA8156]
MICPKKGLRKAIALHRQFHLKTGLLLDGAARLVGVNRCPLTSPLYKLAKSAGYTNLYLSSLALIWLE